MKRIFSTCLLFSLLFSVSYAQGLAKRGAGSSVKAEILKFETKVLSDNTDFKAVDLIKEQQEIEAQLEEARQKKIEYLSARYPEYKQIIEKKAKRQNAIAGKRNKNARRKGTGLKNEKLKLKR